MRGQKHGGSYSGGDYQPKLVQTSSKMDPKDHEVKVKCYKPTAHSGSVGVSGKQSEWKHVASAMTY